MNKSSVAKSISYVMIIMILSRLLSLVSNQIYLAHFGASGVKINIYSYAISVPNIIFNCFGTALATVVIPIYAGHIAQGNHKEARRFADNIITISTILTLILVLAGMALALVLPRFTSFGNDPETYAYTTKALMIMMPVMLFYGLNYIFQGMLQSIGKYGWPAFVSVPSSLIVIFYVLFFADKFGVDGLFVATFIGLSMQAIILIFPLLASGYRYRPYVDFKDPDIITAGKMTGAVLLGVSAYQLNMFYNVTMISNFEGMVTLLTYAQNITVYMVLAFVYSITAVVYPKLTSFAATGDMEGYKSTLTGITKTIVTLLLPVTFGFIAVRFRLLDVIAKWGQITDGEIQSAAKLLSMYSVGIVAIGIKEVYDRAFYAVKNTILPAVNGFIIMAVNIGLSLILIKFMGAYGIPLSYSVSSIVGACVLIVLLRRKIGKFGGNMLVHCIKCVVAALLMFCAVTLLDPVYASYFAADTIIMRIIRLLLPFATGVIVYAIAGYILKIDLICDTADKILRRNKIEESN